MGETRFVNPTLPSASSCLRPHLISAASGTLRRSREQLWHQLAGHSGEAHVEALELVIEALSTAVKALPDWSCSPERIIPLYNPRPRMKPQK